MSDQSEVIEQLGGPSEVHALIEDMYQRIFADDKLAPFFEGVSKERISQMQYEFVLSAFGGPVQYSGSDLRAAHAGRGITPEHYSLFIGHLLAAMKDRNVDSTISDRVLGELATYRDKVIGTPTADG